MSTQKSSLNFINLQIQVAKEWDRRRRRESIGEYYVVSGRGNSPENTNRITADASITLFDNPEISSVQAARVQADSPRRRCSRGALRQQGRSLDCATKLPGWERVDRGRRASVVAVVSTLRRPGRGREADFSASSGRSLCRGRARVRICARVHSSVLSCCECICRVYVSA